jgi:hypothetical protein
MCAARARPNALCFLILPLSNGISTIPVDFILSELQQFLAFHFSHSIRFFIHIPDPSLKDVSHQKYTESIFRSKYIGPLKICMLIAEKFNCWILLTRTKLCMFNLVTNLCFLLAFLCYFWLLVFDCVLLCIVPRELSWYSDRLQAGRPGFDFRQRQESFLYFTVSRPALGPTQPPIQRIPGVLSPGIKQLGREVDHSPPVLRSRMVELYLHSPICLLGLVFN